VEGSEAPMDCEQKSLYESNMEVMAERVGFEPTIPVKVCPLSRRIVSTTHAPLRWDENCQRTLRRLPKYLVDYFNFFLRSIRVLQCDLLILTSHRHPIPGYRSRHLRKNS
jgi:hypothetical protein